jgi:hypothetical protein
MPEGMVGGIILIAYSKEIPISEVKPDWALAKGSDPQPPDSVKLTLVNFPQYSGSWWVRKNSTWSYYVPGVVDGMYVQYVTVNGEKKLIGGNGVISVYMDGDKEVKIWR